VTVTHEMLPTIRRLHDRICERVVAECESQSIARLSEVASDEEGDTIFAIDRVSEEELVSFFENELTLQEPIILIAEGLEGGSRILPTGAREEDARWRIIVDPIDGTRCIMYQKRSAWILTGIAANRGPDTSLEDIELAVQTEIPLVKQHLLDQVWAVRGQPPEAERINRLTGERKTLPLMRSRAKNIEQGYFVVTRFFPGARDVLASIDEDIIREVLGSPTEGKAQAFEDQYTSTGGQLYGLIAGQDRFIADLRPLLKGVLAKRGEPLGLCCHPYDICTKLIAEEAGVIVTDASGGSLDCPLDLETNVTWIGYANEDIRGQVELKLQAVLANHGLL